MAGSLQGSLARFGFGCWLAASSLLSGCASQPPPDTPSLDTGPAVAASEEAGKGAAETGASIRSPKETGCTPSFLSADRIDANAPSLDWGAIHLNCPQSAVAAYNHVLGLLEKGDQESAQRVLEAASARHPGFAPLHRLRKRIETPFAAVLEIADEKLAKRVQRTRAEAGFTRPLPVREALPPLPTLVKGEFESSAMFQERVTRAREARAAAIRGTEARYQREVKEFNRAVARHNARLAKNREAYRTQLRQTQRQLLEQAMAEVFGSPRFVGLRYDADRQLFHGRLVSSRGNFDRPVDIRVPLSGARTFKESPDRVAPRLQFELIDGRIELTGIEARRDGSTFHAWFMQDGYDPVPVSVRLAEGRPPAGEIVPLAMPDRLETEELLSENSRHFQGALNYEDDPLLARQRQELAELARKKREFRRQQSRERERARLQAEIDRSRQQLAALGGQAGEEFKGLKMKTSWHFRPARTQGQDRLAVVIGNRSYGKGIPLVHYALNDARAVRQFLRESYGLAPEEILYEENATRGIMEGIFRKQLRNRVTPGRTDLFVYYSGHGMPVGTDARLLPTDARPETADINGYSRDRLLQQLAELDARSLTVVLDACYSGSSKSGQALQPVKAILAKPKRLQAPDRGVIISAASGRQTAFMDDRSGHSLLTFYLLKGLAGEADSDHDNEVDTGELQQYLGREVNRRALRLYGQPQNPQVKGERRVLIGY